MGHSPHSLVHFLPVHVKMLRSSHFLLPCAFKTTGHPFICLTLGPSRFNGYKSRRMGKKYEVLRGRKCSPTNKWPAFKNAQIYVFALWHPSTIQPAVHFIPLPSSAQSNPIPSGDGQRDGNTLICVAYVLTAGAGRLRRGPPTASLHLSAEWRERMERSRGGEQRGQWIN